MSDIKRLILLNQMAGPLYRELAEGLSGSYDEGCLLFTGHPDTLILRDKVHQKLHIKSAPIYNRSSNISRILSWIKYIISSSCLILKSKKTDAFMIVSNPPILGGWFWLLNKIKNRKYSVLVYDIYPDVLVALGKISEKNIIVKLWRWINYKVYRDASVVITIGHHMAKRLYKQFPKDAKFPEVISPWSNTDKIKPISYKDNYLSQEFNPGNKKVVLYSGNMGASHDIESMLKAAKILKNNQEILFMFVGSGEKWQFANDFARVNNLSNIKVYPFQEEKKLPYSMALATISLVALDVGAEELMVPSKVFYYLAAGSAVIGISKNENELKDIIENNQCGENVEPKNPKGLANVILRMVNNKEKLNFYQQNARMISVKQYSKKSGIEKFRLLLKCSL